MTLTLRPSPGDVEIPQPARLELIHEPVHPQLPLGLGLCPRRGDGARIGDVPDLHAHALLHELQECPRTGRRAEVERARDSDERREPALEHGLDVLEIPRDGLESGGGATAVRVADDENCPAFGKREVLQ